MAPASSSARNPGALRPRVAQLIEALGMGGAERLAVQIANARAEAGDLSHLVVVSEPGALSASVAGNVRVRYLGYERASIANPLAFGLSVRRGYGLIAGQLARDGVQVVQTHLPGANFWGLALALRGACAAIPTIHNNQEFRYGRDDQAWRAGLRRRAYREMLRRCPAVVAVSAEVRDSLVADLRATDTEAARIRVIPNGVEIPEPGDPALVAQARARYGIPPGDPLVLAAGRLSEQKNHALLLEATARLRAAGVRCRVLIAGDGPLRAFLGRRAAEMGLDDQVTLPGNVDDLRLLMQGADVFVLPSLWEGLPLVLLEAMACGLPAVATRIRGVAEVVEDGVSGLLVEPGDAAGLAAAVAALLRDAPRRAALGAAGLEIVRRHYDFARVAEELGRLYAEVSLIA